MCAIVGYTGYKPAAPILIDGLRSVEFRGYDSVGMYISGYGPLKMVGSVQTLAESLPDTLTGMTGIAHTRWATHGVPSIDNTHPHTDHTQSVWVVHNGMVENYHELRDELIGKGHSFTSETDTEVIAHLIGLEYEAGAKPRDAVANALSRVVGTYGIAVIFSNEPNTIIIANMGNSMAIGIKDGEYIIASDTAPMLRHTSNVVKLNDGEYAVVSLKGYAIYSFSHEKLLRSPKTINVALESAKQADKPHHMLKDILEIPSVLENSVRGRLLLKEGDVKFGGLEGYKDELRQISHITIVGCGSSHFAGMVGKLLFEDIAGIPTTIEYGSEFSTRTTPFQDPTHSVLLALSQSGETPEILEAVQKAKQVGIRTFGLVNVVGSTIAKELDTGIYNHAGPEVGVRSTRAFVSQLEILALMALHAGRIRGAVSQARGAEIVAEVQRLPDKVRSILSQRGTIKQIAEEYLGYDDFLFVGRGYNIATAYEGALKLKKVSFVHAEGFPSGEVQHGPISMLNDIFPTVAIMPSDATYEHMLKDIEVLRERKGPILAITTEGNTEVETLVDDVLYVPETKQYLTPILVNIPLQLFAYYTGALRGFNADQPLRPSNVMFDS